MTHRPTEQEPSPIALGVLIASTVVLLVSSLFILHTLLILRRRTRRDGVFVSRAARNQVFFRIGVAQLFIGATFVCANLLNPKRSLVPYCFEALNGISFMICGLYNLGVLPSKPNDPYYDEDGKIVGTSDHSNAEEAAPCESDDKPCASA